MEIGHLETKQSQLPNPHGRQSLASLGEASKMGEAVKLQTLDTGLWSEVETSRLAVRRFGGDWGTGILNNVAVFLVVPLKGGRYIPYI